MWYFQVKLNEVLFKVQVVLKNLLSLYRPSAKAILKHPFFWSREKQLAFFQVTIKKRHFYALAFYIRLKKAENRIVFSGRK